MTISSQILSDIPNTQTTNRVTEEHIDSVSGSVFNRSYVYDINTGFDTAARLASNAISIQSDLEEQEILDGIQTFIDGGDPLHTGPEPSGPFTEVVPLYNPDWDTLASGITFPFLEDEDRNFLRHIEKTIIRISGGDKRRIWDCTNPQVNAINGEIQNAITAQIDLDAYSPLAIEGVVQ